MTTTPLTKKEVTDVLDLSMRKFVELNLKYIKEVRNGKLFVVKNPLDCPLAQWVIYHDSKCSRQMVPNTEACPLCGSPVCPDCMNHNVEIISRVTGYLSTVSGWNEAKQQEFKDRQRYTP